MKKIIIALFVVFVLANMIAVNIFAITDVEFVKPDFENFIIFRVRDYQGNYTADYYMVDAQDYYYSVDGSQFEVQAVRYVYKNNAWEALNDRMNVILSADCVYDTTGTMERYGVELDYNVTWITETTTEEETTAEEITNKVNLNEKYTVVQFPQLPQDGKYIISYNQYIYRYYIHYYNTREFEINNNRPYLRFDAVSSYYYDKTENIWVKQELNYPYNTGVFIDSIVKDSIGEYKAPYIVYFDIDSNDFIHVKENMIDQINVKSIILIISIVITAVVGVIFMWWAVRKIIKAIMSAFKKGKVSL